MEKDERWKEAQGTEVDFWAGMVRFDQLFFDAHTFSILGLAKWHTWTKFRHKNEMLVKAHPYRLFETDVRRMISRHGFAVTKIGGHDFLSACIGHARTSTFLGEKQEG
jgi:hypothetical protein